MFRGIFSTTKPIASSKIPPFWKENQPFLERLCQVNEAACGGGGCCFMVFLDRRGDINTNILPLPAIKSSETSCRNSPDSKLVDIS